MFRLDSAPLENTDSDSCKCLSIDAPIPEWILVGFSYSVESVPSDALALFSA
jgi:hypothetical protein